MYLSQTMTAPPCPSQPGPKCLFSAIIWEGSLVSGALDIFHHQNTMGAFRCSHAKAFSEALHHHRCWDWNSRVRLKLDGVGGHTSHAVMEDGFTEKGRSPPFARAKFAPRCTQSQPFVQPSPAHALC